MKNMKKTPLAAAIGTAVISTLAIAEVQAEVNPFATNAMPSGYMQLAADHNAKSGEMKCGSNMGRPAEGKCGEGKCAGSIDAKKSTEGKCGEGKCGEAKCGSKMKKQAKEGKCGEGKCGGSMKK